MNEMDDILSGLTSQDSGSSAALKILIHDAVDEHLRSYVENSTGGEEKKKSGKKLKKQNKQLRKQFKKHKKENKEMKKIIKSLSGRGTLDGLFEKLSSKAFDKLGDAAIAKIFK